MQEFKVGDRVVEDGTGDEGIILKLDASQSDYVPLRLQVDWQTGLSRGQILTINASSCSHFVEGSSLTIESCIKFLTGQGFSVTLTKG